MKKIIVNLKKIINAPVGIKDKVAIETKIDSPDKEKIRIVSPLTGTTEFTNLEKQILAEFDLDIEMKVICFRCGENFTTKENLKFKRVYKFSDLDAGQNLDILPAIHEEIILSLPIKPLCKNKCKGRCPKCGQNLNVKKCRCQVTIVQDTNKPFVKLKELLTRKNNG